MSVELEEKPNQVTTLIDLNEVWTPPSDEFLGHLMETEGSRLSDEEKRLIDGVNVLGIMEGCYFGLDIFSDNDRFYPKECWINGGVLESDWFKSRITRRLLFGTLGHYLEKLKEHDLAKHLHAIGTYQVWVDKSTNLGMGRSLIYGSDSGKALYQTMATGSKYQMSSRGVGSLKVNDFKVRNNVRIPVVNPATYQCWGFDVVFDPGISVTSANLLESQEENDNVREVIDVMPVENTETVVKVLNESLESLKSEKFLLESKLNSIIKNVPADKINLLESFTGTEWSILLNKKPRILSESKDVSFMRNNYTYDGVFIPVDVTTLSESQLHTALLESLEVKPMGVASIQFNSNSSFGSNGYILLFNPGSRPKVSLMESLEDTSLFDIYKKPESTVITPAGNPMADPLATPIVAPMSDPMSTSVGTSTNPTEPESIEGEEDEEGTEEDAMTDDDMKELNEWRTLSGSSDPIAYFNEVKLMVESLSSKSESNCMAQDKEELLESFLAIVPNVNTLCEWKAIVEDVGDVEELKTSLLESTNFISTFKDKYKSMAHLDKVINEASCKIKSLQESLSKGSINESKNSKGTDSWLTSDMKVLLENQALDISKALKNKMSMGEVYTTLLEHKGDVAKAEDSVFKFLREDAKVDTSVSSMNESKETGKSSVTSGGSSRPAAGSFLRNFYGNSSVKS